MNIFLQRSLFHAEQHPDKVIVVDKWRSWTWSELIECAHAFAVSIQNYDFLSNKPIAIPILAGRSGAVFSSILGTLMCGHAISLLNPKQPSERLMRYINLLDADVAIDARHVDEIVPLNLKVNLLKFKTTQVKHEVEILDKRDDDILYVLFTSGSTGSPKGVVCSNANIINTMEWSTTIINWESEDTIGCATQFSFDIASFDLFTALYFNVKVVIFPEPSNILDVYDRILKHSITSIFATPAFFAQFIRAKILQNLNYTTLRRILSGGDFFPPSHIIAWREHASDVIILNVWGPTETSIVNTMHQVNDTDLNILIQNQYPSIGREHPLMPIVLIDKNGNQINKPNTRGEILMLGACVSLGYLKNEALTSEVFTEFRNQKAFRTGDIGYRDKSGNIFIAGRAGSIIKIAGYRVDLGDVEAALVDLDNVHAAGAFIADNAQGIPELCAAVDTGEKMMDFDIFSSKKILRRKLPSYMVPKRILVKKSLPINLNGKIDRKTIKIEYEGTKS